MSSLQRIFLDTNVFIIGDANKQSDESLILEALVYRDKPPILISMEVQIVLFLEIES